MKFNKATLVATAAAMSLGLAACDSAAENEAEENIEEMEDARDNQVEGALDELLQRWRPALHVAHAAAATTAARR